MLALPDFRILVSFATSYGQYLIKLTDPPYCRSQANENPQGETQLSMGASLATAAGLLTPFLLDVDPALAGNPLLTGKTVSLIHPAVMLFLFGSTAWTGWLGWQWR